LHPNRNIVAIARHRDFDMPAHMPAGQADQRYGNGKGAQIDIYWN